MRLGKRERGRKEETKMPEKKREKQRGDLGVRAASGAGDTAEEWKLYYIAVI